MVSVEQAGGQFYFPFSIEGNGLGGRYFESWGKPFRQLSPIMEQFNRFSPRVMIFGRKALHKRI